MTAERQIKGILGQIARIREQANLRVERLLREAGIEGILPAHGAILNFLFRQTVPVPMKEIVEKVGRVKSTVTGMINTLELYGYVEKFQSAEDGRVMLVRLTDKGDALKPHFDRISATIQTSVYGDMPLHQKEQLVKLLTQIEGNLKSA